MRKKPSSTQRHLTLFIEVSVENHFGSQWDCEYQRDPAWTQELLRRKEPHSCILYPMSVLLGSNDDAIQVFLPFQSHKSLSIFTLTQVS